MTTAFQSNAFQTSAFQIEVVVSAVEDDGSWESIRQYKRQKSREVPKAPDFDKHREAARLELDRLEQDDDALILLLMAA
jgi:hypothetical protein